MAHIDDQESFADDILCGASAIADYIFGDTQKRGRIYYLCAKKHLPHFRFGERGIAARKSTLRGWVKQQEQRNSGHLGNTKEDKSLQNLRQLR